jgi:hypothetical protein
MSTKVRSYTDKELLDKVKGLKDFKGFPEGRWWIFVRSNEDTPNVYDDKGYLYETINGQTNFIDVVSCTTNPGTEALKGGFKKFNKKGAALIKAGQWCYNSFYYGLHSGRMPALRQRLPIWYHRDGDGDLKSEELGEPIHDIYYTNIHSNTYKHFNNVVKWFIGAWSYGCIVINQRDKYMNHMNWFKAKRQSGEQRYVTICIIDEF